MCTLDNTEDNTMKRKMTIFLLVAILAVSVCVMAACNDDKGILTGGDENKGDDIGQVQEKNPLESAVEEIKQQFSSISIDSCMNIADDWTYVEIDTNPYNVDDYYNATYNKIVTAFNEALDLPDYIENEMEHTNALMGVRTETVGDIEVSWSYHPNNGLNAIYKYKG